MHVAMSPDIAGVCPPLSCLESMASKRVGSKDIDESATRGAIEQVSTSLPIYEDTTLIVGKEIKLKCQEVNDEFSSTFGKYLKDH